jgi:hypothetical protein
MCAASAQQSFRIQAHNNAMLDHKIGARQTKVESV